MPLLPPAGRRPKGSASAQGEKPVAAGAPGGPPRQGPHSNVLLSNRKREERRKRGVCLQESPESLRRSEPRVRPRRPWTEPAKPGSPGRGTPRPPPRPAHGPPRRRGVSAQGNHDLPRGSRAATGPGLRCGAGRPPLAEPGPATPPARRPSDRAGGRDLTPPRGAHFPAELREHRRPGKEAPPVPPGGPRRPEAAGRGP